MYAKLQLKTMMEEGEGSLYQKHEAATLHHTLAKARRKVLRFPQRKISGIHLRSHPLPVPLDIFRRTGGAPANKAQIDKLVGQYKDLKDSGLLMQIRVGFAWMYPKEEDPTHRSFQARIKYYLAAPRKPLSPNLKSGNPSMSDSDSTSGGTFARPNILVPRKRALSRGEKMVQASLPPVTSKKPKKKARCATPMSIDATESFSDSKFQDTLLEEGCGTPALCVSFLLSWPYP
jgi:hypothetical protein